MADPIPVRIWGGAGYSVPLEGTTNAFGPTAVLGADASFGLGPYRRFGVGLSVELLGGLGVGPKGFTNYHYHDRAITFSFGPSMSWRGDMFLWRTSLNLIPAATLLGDCDACHYGYGAGLSASMDELYRVTREWSVGAGVRVGGIIVHQGRMDYGDVGRSFVSFLAMAAWTPFYGSE
jgi:hypothetical protein